MPDIHDTRLEHLGAPDPEHPDDLVTITLRRRAWDAITSAPPGSATGTPQPARASALMEYADEITLTRITPEPGDSFHFTTTRRVLKKRGGR